MIVDRLSRGECSVGDLRELVGSDLSTVSKHLALLRAHGILEDRREGRNVYYRLLTPFAGNFCTCATLVLEERSGLNRRSCRPGVEAVGQSRR